MPHKSVRVGKKRFQIERNHLRGDNSCTLQNLAVLLQRQSPKPPRDWRCKLSGGNPKPRQP